MNNEPLAPIFLDNKPVDLKDPKPRVSSVLSAGGRQGVTEVKWLQTQSGSQGTFLRPDHTLDRTSTPAKAIYLSSQARESPAQGKAVLADEDMPVPSLKPWPQGSKQPKGQAEQGEGPADAAGETDDAAKAGPQQDMRSETAADVTREGDDESPKTAA